MKSIEQIIDNRKGGAYEPKRKLMLALFAFAAVIALSTIALIAVGAYNRNTAGNPYPKPEQPGLASIQPQPLPRPAIAAQSGDDLKAVAVTLYRQGFEMREIVRPAGPFLFAVINRSGLRSITLSLRQKDGPSLRQSIVQRERPQWGDILDLAPGEYILSVEGRPEWDCKITVTGR